MIFDDSRLPPLLGCGLTSVVVLADVGSSARPKFLPAPMVWLDARRGVGCPSPNSETNEPSRPWLNSHVHPSMTLPHSACESPPGLLGRG